MSTTISSRLHAPSRKSDQRSQDQGHSYRELPWKIMATKRSLKDVLSGNDNVSYNDQEVVEGNDVELHDPQKPIDEESNRSLCVECGDQPLELECKQCDEGFCEVCFKYLHRTGKRQRHETVAVQRSLTETAPSTDANAELQPDGELTDQDMEESAAEVPKSTNDVLHAQALAKFRANTKFIPMRLSQHERKLFKLLEAALEVSQYTDKVDILYAGPKARRIVSQLREMCTILTGLVVSNGLDDGHALMESKEFSQHSAWFQQVFEIGRRYKIQNPEKMRSTFGKLMYMIMDSRLPEIRDTMEFDLYMPVKTVADVLEQGGASDMLSDPLILQATQSISAENNTRDRIQRQIRAKEAAIKTLSSKYSKSSTLSSETICQALYSVGDYHAYLMANRAPVKRILDRLTSNFESETPESAETNLHIAWGREGARLSHSHKEQFQYVQQSLTLWSEIMREMYHLWKLADDDLCNEDYRYRLCDTGQGLNRIKPCPKVNHMMHVIIQRAQKIVGSWIGSAVVHLGDHTVPNALFFLDKYLQVPRILTPIGRILDSLPQTFQDPHALAWAKSQYGSVDNLIQCISIDFFRHAFDGSGANNFYDAGSCIDGRLTSAWHWANSISKKPYYKFFLVSGFTGFDGEDGF